MSCFFMQPKQDWACGSIRINSVAMFFAETLTDDLSNVLLKSCRIHPHQYIQVNFMRLFNNKIWHTCRLINSSKKRSSILMKAHNQQNKRSNQFSYRASSKLCCAVDRFPHSIYAPHSRIAIFEGTRSRKGCPSKRFIVLFCWLAILNIEATHIWHGNIRDHEGNQFWIWKKRKLKEKKILSQ